MLQLLLLCSARHLQHPRSRLAVGAEPVSVETLVSPCAKFHVVHTLKRILPPFAISSAFDDYRPRRTQCLRSTRFCPPHHYWLSQAEPSTLLRVHLPPHTDTRLELLLELVSPKKKLRNRCQASSVTAPVPARNATLKHSVGLTEYWASRYFGRLPTNAAEAGLLTLCVSSFLWLPSDPTVSQ